MPDNKATPTPPVSREMRTLIIAAVIAELPQHVLRKAKCKDARRLALEFMANALERPEHSETNAVRE